MENIIEELKAEPKATLSKLRQNTKDRIRIDNLIKEYDLIDRNIRDTQIGKVQKDKFPKGKDPVIAVRIPIAYQKKIVNTSTAFEVGEPVTLIPSSELELHDEIDRLWRNNRIDFKIQELIKLKKSQLQSALLFSIEDIQPNHFVNRILGANKNKEIKTKILKNSEGVMTPVWNAYGDMVAFIWEYSIKEVNKTIDHAMVIDDKNTYFFSTTTGGFELIDTKEHGFSKIPIVYLSQDNEEWFDVKEMIDRLEVAISKLGAANDYSGQPILKLYGEVAGSPNKNDDGKVLRMNMIEDKETGKISHGEAKFLERESAAETVKLELELLNQYISSITSTPDWSFEALSGLGTISGKALRLMFIDPITKAKMNEGYNRTVIERIINVFISGTITTTMKSIKSQASDLYYDIQFNSIIPNDDQEQIASVINAVNGNVMSLKTAVKLLSMTDDDEQELEDIQDGQKIEYPETVTLTT